MEGMLVGVSAIGGVVALGNCGGRVALGTNIGGKVALGGGVALAVGVNVGGKGVGLGVIGVAVDSGKNGVALGCTFTGMVTVGSGVALACPKIYIVAIEVTFTAGNVVGRAVPSPLALETCCKLRRTKKAIPPKISNSATIVKTAAQRGINTVCVRPGTATIDFCRN